MFRQPQLVRVTAALLVAVCWLAVADAVLTKLQEACAGVETDVTCRCSREHPDIFFVSGDVKFMMGKRVMVIENCSKVTLAGDPVKYAKTAALQELRIQNVTHLELELALPKSLRKLVLSNIRELSPIPVSVFQVVGEMDTLTMQDVTFTKLESHFLQGMTLNLTEITGCRFHNLDRDSMNLTSLQVVIKANNFTNLSTEALTVQSMDVTISDNSFEAMANGSIKWQHWSEEESPKLVFHKNTFLSLETGALSGLRLNESSSMLSDNVILCPDEEYKRCKERMALYGNLRVCDAKDVCRYRKRTALTEELATMRGCAADQPMSADMCAFLVVGKELNIPKDVTTPKNPSGTARLLAPSSITAAISLVVITWFTA